MKNHQAPTARRVHDGHTLFVHSIFPTIQGEGPHAGKAATFVRLAGCNLQCPLCDTEYTEGAQETEVTFLANHLSRFPNRLIVITGGEPFRQNLGPFTSELLRLNYLVQIETNGQLSPQGFDIQHWTDIDIVVSPKTGRLNADIAEEATAYKYVVVHGHVDEDGFPTHALEHPLPKGKRLARPPEGWHGPIYIQPADQKDPVLNNFNLQAATEIVMRHPDRFRLGIQMHKEADLP